MSQASTPRSVSSASGDGVFRPAPPLEMEAAHGEWVERCAAGLHTLWPEVDAEHLTQVAEVLWSDRRSTIQPEYAAILAARACGKSRPVY